MKVFLCFVIVYSSLANSTNAQSLDGQWWIAVPKPGEVLHADDGLIFKKDSLTIVIGGHYQPSQPYRLSGDSIQFKNWENKLVKYKTTVTPDSLALDAISGSTHKYYSRKLQYDPTLKFNKITFEETSPLSSDFSKIQMSLDEHGNSKFTGFKKGANRKEKFKVDSEVMYKFDSVFKWTYINGMDPTHFYGNNSPNVLTITLEYNDGEKIVIRGIYELIPSRLRGLTWFLMRELRKRNLI